MSPFLTSAARGAGLALQSLLLTVLTACGGGSVIDGTATAQTAAPANVGVKFVQSSTLNADGPATQLTVRAHGVIVGSVEVRATEPSDYPFNVPALKPGSKVDVVFGNNAVVGGVDRDLFIDHVIAGSTYVIPTAPGAIYDIGRGDAAFDGVDVRSGQSAMYSSGALRLVWPEPNLTDRLTVRASATLAGDIGPKMALRVNGVTVGSTEVRSASPADHVFAVPALTAGSKVDVVLTNQGTINGSIRSLNVAYLMANDTVLRPDAAGVLLDLGNDRAAFDGLYVQPGRAVMAANGALRAKWPERNMTDRLTVRASASLAGNVGALMQVRVDGVVLGTTEVRSTTPRDYYFSTLPVKPGSQVDVVYMNDAVVNGDDRNLYFDYVITGDTVVLPTSAGVLYDRGIGEAAFDGLDMLPGQVRLVWSGALRIVWPQPNLTDRLTVRARGILAGDVGPQMGLRVDGVMVGVVEVRAVEPADFTFAVPRLKPGSKVDVVFTNNALVNGVDRDLFIDYLVAGSTYIRPDGPGTTYDVGRDAAAFDGIDVRPGQGAMYSSGALRLTWPDPNITEQLTLRASGTIAGNVGPIVQLRVDGVIVGQSEVRATAATDYSFAVPPLNSGSKIDVLFVNAGEVEGVTRQLEVAYLMTGQTVLRASAAGVAYSSGSLSASWPAPNLTDTVTVRAHGVLAGDLGPVMQLRVDGVIVGSVEVRATEPADYQFKAPPLNPGSKLDVVFTNNAVVDGADRDLHVAYVIAGTTFALPSGPDVVYDLGRDAAAFDGRDVRAGQSAMYSSGALRFTWPSPNLVDFLTVRASAIAAGNAGPLMQVRVDGVTVASTEVISTTPTDHRFFVPALKVGSKIDVVFTNQASINGVKRTLNVAYLLANNTVVLPDDAGVLLDLGNDRAAFDGLNMHPGQSAITSNGALRFKWPAPNMTDRLIVRAAGSLAGNVGPIMQVRVDGVVLGATEVRATQYADYGFATLPIKPGAQVDVVFTNDALVNGEDRNLFVDYVVTDDTVVLPKAPEVRYDRGAGNAAFDGLDVLAGRARIAWNGALRTAWPQPNRTDRLTVRARGTIAGDLGPLIYVRVDGVIVGNVEVRATEPADYTFAVPPLKPGSKIDVVFTNNALVNGIDRDLFIDYLIAGSTYIRPNAPGATYDIGRDTAAFDGSDVRPGQGAMYSSGALRLSWPASNITEKITLRASGSVAGNVGPIAQLRVDGVPVSSVEVRAKELTDYSMAVPELKAGSKIDVVYTNDGVINGVDRNLRVAYLQAGNTFVQADSLAVRYDRGTGAAAFDNLDVLPGQSEMNNNGALRLSWPAANVTDRLTVRASGTQAANVGPVMQLRVNGVILGTVEVRATTSADYTFAVPALTAGSQIDVVYLNNATINGEDRNLFVQYLKTGSLTLVPTAPDVVRDYGANEAAFDGANTAPGDGVLYSNGALRFKMPASQAADPSLPAQYAAARFLQQATFGPTLAEVQRLTNLPYDTWLTEQMAMPVTPEFVPFLQSKFDLGDDYRPKGRYYTNSWLGQRFWAAVATSPDQLRKRMLWTLHQILTVSQADSNLYDHSRAYASYLDTLNKHAFGNFRALLEEVAMSPAMGIYLSHLRNRKEDPLSGRLPDENFAREVMQLFTIGLHELNIDGTSKLDGQGQPIETYNNDDVMALAKVFTGFSWAFPDSQLTEQTFRWGWPDYRAASDLRVDVLRMKAYPGQQSTAEKRLFTGKANAVTIPANATAQDNVRIALDALFNHPNVGPFIGRQLIQHLVSSNPSPGYVARVAAKFNNNGSGVRGDLASVARAVLLDTEARNPPSTSVGKLREPVLRVANWMRSMNAKSGTGQYMMTSELSNQGQRVLYAPSVFGYYRPGFVPPNTVFAAAGITVPGLQIVNESSTAHWVNLAATMTGSGLGWTGTATDVRSSLDPLVALAAGGNVHGLIEQLNLLLLAGRMSSTLRQDLLDAVTGVLGTTATANVNRARVALFLTLASPEYLVQH